ncbi:hypothetical protein NDI54_04250 [Haloarcula sp. S1AR25-5A]|uniref:DUF7988 domain-containing protein n=1 Tax=Haloarcula terrestris TaxID=2950533 RepID=A0AAE4EUV8_9EURY|nr:hypothetical protein [Haloarcula terrestris]MDS0220560.1 hypothetical protein [Haloarcula terrestris]
MTQSESTIRTRLLEAHPDTLQSVIDAGCSVATAWPAETVQEPGAVTDPLEHLLRKRGLAEDLLGMLQSGTAAIGETVQGRLIPAPPYLVVTSRGPICRGTMSDGRRLVVLLELFAVQRKPVRYRFRNPTPTELLSVSIR